MCQAYDSERRFVVWMENQAVMLGYKAHLDGKPLSDNSVEGIILRNDSWRHGWNCRNERLVPWCLEKKWREKRREETGEYNYETPSIEQADLLV